MSTSPTQHVRLASQALDIFAQHVGENKEDTETVMAEFLAAMMALAEKKGADFDAILESARSQAAGGF